MNNGIITPCTIASQDGRSGLSLLWSPGPVCCLVSTLFRTFELLRSHYNYNYFIAACSICSRIIHTYDSASCLRSWLLWPCYQVNAMISTSCAAIYSSLIQPSGQSLHLSGCSWKFDFRRKFNLLWVAINVLIPINSCVTYPYLEDGRRPVYLVSLPLLCAGSLGVALSRGVPELMVLRFLQAIGCSAGLSVGSAVIGDIYKLEERYVVQWTVCVASLTAVWLLKGNCDGCFLRGWSSLCHVFQIIP